MLNTPWQLVPEGMSIRDFQSTLLAANVALDKNLRSVHVTTTDAQVVLSYLVRLAEITNVDPKRHIGEQLNLCEIARTLYEAPQSLASSPHYESSEFIRIWLQAKIDMLGCALHQERPRANKESIRFLSVWHMIVSDLHLR